MAEEQGNIKQEFNLANTGLNLDLTPNQIKKGMLTYALNAAVENFDASSVNYQNEQGNELCVSFPEGYVLIGTHFINELSKHIFFITNPATGGSQIGYMDNNDCVYRVLVNASCLNFNIAHPIHKCVHKITNCTTEIYWTDGYNPRRYLNINDIPKILKFGSPLCDPIYEDEVDCNQLKIQPNFSIPQLEVADVLNGGNLISGAYQFAIQYSDASGNPYTSYYSITNPTPIADPDITTVNFNYAVGKSVVINVSNLDTTGQFQYFNLAVIKTINAITSAELAGTYFIEQSNRQVIYTGQIVDNIRLSINDIFEKFPYYDIAQDVTTAQDVLIWDNLSAIDRINYQQIANKIQLEWETWRIPADENYSDELNATNLRGYLRDEVYPFEIVFLLTNGKQTDGFHIPGRELTVIEKTIADIPDTDEDFVGTPHYESGGVGYSPYWAIYNTASVLGYSDGYSSSPTYKGPYQYGEFAYWESTEEYPCNEDVWGELAGQKIRHHKFPDVEVSPIFESKLFSNAGSMVMGNDAIFPIGVKISPQDIESLINSSNLTSEQKAEIVGFKIVRGDRSTNKSIIAKGILRNVGEYEKEDNTYYFPNYPYNDLNQDRFLNGSNNAYSDECVVYEVRATSAPKCKISFKDCNTNTLTERTLDTVGPHFVCALSRPVAIPYAPGEDSEALVQNATYEVWKVVVPMWRVGIRVGYYSRTGDFINSWVSGYLIGDHTEYFNVIPDTGGVVWLEGGDHYSINYINTVTVDYDCGSVENLPAIKDRDDLRYRQIFNSPETSFGQPFLGDVLKLESVIFGKGLAHFVQVKDNAKYKLLTEEAQTDALDAADEIGQLADPADDPSAMMVAYQAYLQIYLNGMTRRNFAYSFNSIADYNYSVAVPNGVGAKQRNLDIKKYLIPGVISTGDVNSINNWNRESSVYLRTELEKTALPFPDKSPNMILTGNSLLTDYSRFTISDTGNCDIPEKKEDINVVSYYAAIKNSFLNQWGQIYSYTTIDTGYQEMLNTTPSTYTVFGGDTFIGRFAFKTKLPFFIDWRVNAPDDSDIFYDEIGNVGYPKYWHSARSIQKNYAATGVNLPNIISYKAHNFDCPNSQFVAPGDAKDTNPDRLFYDGKFYLFAYGVPNFYCESSYNLDLRQAFNNREGDFWPHVSTDIPDDWVQQTFVPIAQDNTYYYNVTYSKQNKENTFSHLPPDWEDKLCYTHYPFRAIYSDAQNTDADNEVNSWLIYKALSYYDFPQNYGSLISLDGIQNRAVLARFENKTLLYNNLLTIDTSNPQAAYVGNNKLFDNQYPPIDFAETDLGYVGSQHKVLLKIPQGQITIDAKRGQVFLIGGTQATDLSAFGSGMNRFFTDHLAFEILRYFPNADVDNHFNNLGLHGVYDSKFDRVIITKLDYIPIDPNVKYDAETKEFYIENIISIPVCDCDLWGTALQLDPCRLEGIAIQNGTPTTTSTTSTLYPTSTTTTTKAPCREVDYITRTIVSLKDTDYFCNKSWTLSFNMNTKSWISFHSYIPNWYIAENNFFYSGVNGCCEDFDFIAGTLIPNPPTTTTTSTTTIYVPVITTTTTSTSTSTSTTTTTTTSTTTTTTTVYVCERPDNVEYVELITGYEIISPAGTVDSTGSPEEACSALTLLNTRDPNIYPTFIPAEAVSMTIGSTVYAGTGTDCTCVPDGWYFTNESMFYDYVIHIESCVITEFWSCEVVITTSTTTSSTSTTTTTTTIYIAYCGENVTYEGPGYPITVQVNLGATADNIMFYFDTDILPDRLIVRWDSSEVIDTGYWGSFDYDYGGSNRAAFMLALDGKVDPLTALPYPDLINFPDDGYPRIAGFGEAGDGFDKNAASPEEAYVDIYAPLADSVGRFILDCPGVTTTTTSSTTSTTTSSTTTTSTTSTTTSTTTSSTTTTTTTRPPYYEFSISNYSYLSSVNACSSFSIDVPPPTVYAALPIGELTGEQLYLDSGLTLPYGGPNGYHWFIVEPYTPGDPVYWVSVTAGVVTNEGNC